MIKYGTGIQPQKKVSYTHTILTIALVGCSLEWPPPLTTSVGQVPWWAHLHKPCSGSRWSQNLMVRIQLLESGENHLLVLSLNKIETKFGVRFQDLLRIVIELNFSKKFGLAFWFHFKILGFHLRFRIELQTR